MERSQREALIRGFTHVAHRIVPSIPEEDNFVFVKDVSSGKGGRMTTKGDKVLVPSKELDALKNRISRLEEVIAFSAQASKMLSTEFSDSKNVQRGLQAKQAVVQTEQEELKAGVESNRNRIEGLYILTTIGRLLSLPDVERYQSTLFPLVRKLSTLRKKVMNGEMGRSDAKKKYNAILREVKVILKDHHVPAKLLYLAP